MSDVLRCEGESGKRRSRAPAPPVQPEAGGVPPLHLFRIRRSVFRKGSHSAGDQVPFNDLALCQLQITLGRYFFGRD